MTVIPETYVTGAKVQLFFCLYVEGTRRFFHPWHGGSCAGSLGRPFQPSSLLLMV